MPALMSMKQPALAQPIPHRATVVVVVVVVLVVVVVAAAEVVVVVVTRLYQNSAKTRLFPKSSRNLVPAKIWPDFKVSQILDSTVYFLQSLPPDAVR